VSEIVIVVPVLGRPDNVAPLVANVLQETTVPHRIVFVCNPDDDAEIEAVLAAGADMLIIDEPAGPGDFARKLNHAYQHTREPWIFQAADDVVFHPGWAEACLHAAGDRYMVVGTQDLANPVVRRGHHSTHSLIRRCYVDDPGASADGPGSVFSEVYHHQWCDNELIGLAKSRGLFVFAKDAVVEHRHPIWRTAPDDETYRRGAAHARDDRALFQRRQRMWT
jgi:glycosyltransferase involved in cell wall biosynthesis